MKSRFHPVVTFGHKILMAVGQIKGRLEILPDPGQRVANPVVTENLINSTAWNAEAMTESKKSVKRFNVVLLIRHPEIDPEQISRELSLKPYSAFKNGTIRSLPNGNVLPGLATQSSWNHIYRFSGDHELIEAVEGVVELLEEHRPFILRLCLQGGSCQVYLQLPGDVNVGGVLPWQLLDRMSSVRVELGVEVFPSLP